MSVSWAITPERAIELHAFGIDRWGGPKPVSVNRRCVEGAIELAVSGALYDLPPDAHDEDADPIVVAAYALVYLARDHCFGDGNKRIAWMACAEQLAVFGMRVVATQTEVVTLVNAVVTREMDKDAVRAWLTSPGRLAPWDPSQDL